MSIRIHELAKRHNMEGKDMLALLKELNFIAADTKSVSSTVSKIYEEEFEKYMAEKNASAAAAEAPIPEPEPAPAAPRVPMVKSVEDVARERAEAAARAAAEAAPAPEPVAPPRPVVSAPPAAPAPVSAPRPV